MVNPQVLEFIDRAQKAGQKKEDIQAALSAKGWSAEEIRVAFHYLNPSTPPTSAPPTDPEFSTSENNTLSISPSQAILNFKNLKWYELVALVPAILLLVSGGALGGLFGGVGWVLSLKVIRNESLSTGLKVVSVVGITVAYSIAFVIAAAILLSLLGGSQDSTSH